LRVFTAVYVGQERSLRKLSSPPQTFVAVANLSWIA
jgi:hypothetical protein